MLFDMWQIVTLGRCMSYEQHMHYPSDDCGVVGVRNTNLYCVVCSVISKSFLSILYNPQACTS